MSTVKTINKFSNSRERHAQLVHVRHVPLTLHRQLKLTQEILGSSLVSGILLIPLD